MAKFLIIRLSSMGDIILTTPVVRCIKEQFPNAEIHFLVKQKHMDAIKGNKNISKIHGFTTDLRKTAAKLKHEHFDYVIDLHNNLRSSYIKMKLKVKSYTFKKHNFEKWLYTRWHINRLPKNHIVDRYMDAVEPLGIKNDHKGLDFHIREKDQVAISTLPDFLHQGYIAFVIGGTYFTKRLPNTKIMSIINKLNKPVVLIGGDEDSGNGHEIASKCSNKVYNACGKFKLGQSASILDQALYTISHDTGLMHIAAALKKPLVSVWGNTTPEFGMAPYYGEEQNVNTTFEIHNLGCRPCSKLGHSSCPKKHFKCMELIETTKIAKLINDQC